MSQDESPASPPPRPPFTAFQEQMLRTQREALQRVQEQLAAARSQFHGHLAQAEALRTEVLETHERSMAQANAALRDIQRAPSAPAPGTSHEP